MVTCLPLTSSFQYSIGIRQLVLIYVNILNLDRNYIYNPRKFGRVECIISFECFILVTIHKKCILHGVKKRALVK